MHTLNKIIPLALGAAVACAPVGPDEGESQSALSNCQDVVASFTNVTYPCASLCTAGVQVHEGNANSFLDGTNDFVLAGTAEYAGMPGIEPQAQLSHSGTRTVTSRRGTLTLHVTGVFDTQPTSNLDFAELSRITGGTGQLANATGVIWAYGNGEAHPDGSMTFHGHLRGTVCGL